MKKRFFEKRRGVWLQCAEFTEGYGLWCGEFYEDGGVVNFVDYDTEEEYLKAMEFFIINYNEKV